MYQVTICRPLLPISEFVVDDEKFQQNASKFAIIFYTIQKPKVAFFISCYFIFLPNECPGLCQHRPGHLLVKKIKLVEMKNEKNYTGFLIIRI